jgi:hypothetical protein
MDAKDQMPAPDAEAQAIFAQGHGVGGWGRKLFPYGVQTSGCTLDFNALVRQSEQALNPGQRLFEAAFRSTMAIAQADILQSVTGGAHDVIEIKNMRREHVLASRNRGDPGGCGPALRGRFAP